MIIKAFENLYIILNDSKLGTWIEFDCICNKCYFFRIIWNFFIIKSIIISTIE